MRIRWTRGALRDLESAFKYIARDRPEAARRVATRIQDAIASLTMHPGLGRPGRVAGTRELIVLRTSFIVPYRIRGDFLEILGVIHTARTWPERF